MKGEEVIIDMQDAQNLAEEKGLLSEEESFRIAEERRLKEYWGDLWNDDYAPSAPEF